MRTSYTKSGSLTKQEVRMRSALQKSEDKHSVCRRENARLQLVPAENTIGQPVLVLGRTDRAFEYITHQVRRRFYTGE